MTLFSAILFDCDGVLVDSEGLALEVEIAYLAGHGLTFERDDYLSRFLGLTHDAAFDAMDVESLSRFGHTMPDGARAEMADLLRQAMIARLTAVSGAAQAVAAVTLPKAVASSSTKAGLERKLRQVGMWEMFAPHVYSAEQVARGKPAPDLFLHAAAALGVVPGSCLVIEDSVHGVRAARAAGMQVWGFLGGSHADAALGARLTKAGAVRLMADWASLSAALALT